MNQNGIQWAFFAETIQHEGDDDGPKLTGRLPPPPNTHTSAQQKLMVSNYLYLAQVRFE
jgi:hypothetical protein